ncbi:MAG: hypothetical protein V3R98_13080 [Alphaproteobacteria bacterium]
MKRMLIAAALLAATSGPALAGHCPRDVAAIDEALSAGTSLTAEQIAQVTEWRNQGAQSHEGGSHGDALNVLHQAMEMLDVEH